MIAGPFGSPQELLRRLAACRNGDDVGIVEDWTDELLEAVAQNLERVGAATSDNAATGLQGVPEARAGAAVAFRHAAAMVRQSKPPAVRRSWRRERPPR